MRPNCIWTSVVLVAAVLAAADSTAASLERQQPEKPAGGIEIGIRTPAIAGGFVVSDEPSWVLAGGSVEAIVRWGDTLYLGGDFDQLGPFTGSAAVISPRDGTVTADLPAVVEGDVRAIVEDGLGGWFLGGSFLRVGGVPCAGLAHIRADGSHDSGWCPNPGVGYRYGQARVLALARLGSTLFVGGQFKVIAGEKRLRLAAFDIATGELLPWNPSVRGKTVFDRRERLPRGVHALHVAGSTLYVGGFFERVAGQRRASLAALDAATGKATSWNPGVGPSWAWVDALSVADGTVYLAGNFKTLAGRARYGIGAVDEAGRATNWKPALEGSDVYGLALDDDRVFVGGYSVTETGVCLVAFDRSSGAPLWQAMCDGLINAVDVSDNVVHVGGAFQDLNGATRHRLAAFDAATGELTSWDPRANYDVLALEAEGDELVAGGRFTGVGGELRSNLAAVNALTGEIEPFAPNLDFELEALVIEENTLYAGGDQLAAFSLPEGTPTDWNPTVDGDVQTLAADDGTVYVGGTFARVDGEIRSGIAAIAANGQILPWRSPLRGISSVYAVAVHADSVFVGLGAQSDSEPILYELSRTNGSAKQAWLGTGVVPGVQSLSLAGNRLYIAGEFSSLGGQPRRDFAAISTDTAQLLPWIAPSTTTPYGTGQSIAATEQTVYLNGDFSQPTGQSYSVKAVDATTGAVLPWAPHPISRTGSELFLIGGSLYIDWLPLAAYGPTP
jgi:hypothetical protein